MSVNEGFQVMVGEFYNTPGADESAVGTINRPLRVAHSDATLRLCVEEGQRCLK